MTQLTNTFEGGTNGTTLTGGSGGNTGGGSGDFFNQVNIPAGADLVFTSANKFIGALAVRLATRATAGALNFIWTSTSRGSIADDYARFYYYTDDITTGGIARNIVRWYSGGSSLGGILMGNNRLYVTDNTNAVASGNSTTLLPAAQWVRIEYHLHPRTDGTGSVQIKLWLNPNSSGTPDWDYTISGLTYAAATTDQVIFGNAGAPANWPSATGSMYFDGIVTGAATWVGAASGAKAVVPAGISATSTVSGAIRKKGRITPSGVSATSTVAGSVHIGSSIGDPTLPYYGEGAYGETTYGASITPPGGGGGGTGGTGQITPGQPPIIPPATPTGDAVIDFIESSPPILFPENEESNFGFVIRGLWTAKVEDLIGKADLLYKERFVSSSEQFLDEWERMTGTPANPAVDLQTRRAIVLGRIRKGPFTRAMRKEIIERYLAATYRGGVSLTPTGLSITSAGISLSSGSTAPNLSAIYKVVENISGFSYVVYILNSYTPAAGLANELERVTPAGISFSINFVATLP